MLQQIQQFRSTAGNLLAVSQQLQGSLSSLQSTADGGASDCSSAVSSADEAGRDTADIDSSSIGNTLQSSIDALKSVASSVSEGGSSATSSASSNYSGIQSLRTDMRTFADSLPEGSDRTTLESALGELDQAGTSQNSAYSSANSVGFASNNIGTNLSWADWNASKVAGDSPASTDDTPGTDVSSSGIACSSLLGAAQTGFSNSASDAGDAATSQGFVSQDLQSVVDILGAAPDSATPDSQPFPEPGTTPLPQPTNLESFPATSVGNFFQHAAWPDQLPQEWHVFH